MNPSEQVDTFIKGLEGWQAEMVARLHMLIHQADPAITEEWKWGTPVFSHQGMVCAIGAFKDHVKINFFNGANLPDPHKLINSGLEAKKTRAIDLYEGVNFNEIALIDLIRAAVSQKR